MAITFKELDRRYQSKLRRIYHWTDAKTALRILRSSHIWSRDPLGFANFDVRRNPHEDDVLPRAPEVSLTFKYQGPIQIVDLEFDPANYQRNVMYMHLATGTNFDEFGNLRIRHTRIPAGSTRGLKCFSCRPSVFYREKMMQDPKEVLVAEEIDSLLEEPRPIFVPRSAQERHTLLDAYPVITFGMVELLRLKIGLFKAWRFG
jgi:hypothetical protein